MGRISSNTDEKLIRTGVSLARQKGLKNFTVRELCARSQVNLGMFHYYFKTRETFDAAVLKSLYEEMMSAITVEVLPSRTPRQNIESALRAVYAFAGKNRRLISRLIGDSFSGDRQIVHLVSQLFGQHVSVLINELKRAQQLGQLRTQNVRDALLLLLPQVPLAQAVLGLAERMGKNFPPALRRQVIEIAGPEDTFRRARFMLQAVLGDSK